MKILLLGSQHGNEPLGDMLYEHIKRQHTALLPYITFKIGNPRAHEQEVRYIESDMNRSYDDTLSTYESLQAKHMLQFIEEGEFDLVLDLHTTVCNQPPCFILPKLNATLTPFIRASHIERIVLITDSMVHATLTGVNSKVVAIEVANSELTPKLLEMLCRDIVRYIRGDVSPSQKKVYDVPSLLLKIEVAKEDIDSLVNFKKTQAGYIPILVGKNSYRKTTHYLGFKATTETIITL